MMLKLNGRVAKRTKLFGSEVLSQFESLLTSSNLANHENLVPSSEIQRVITPCPWLSSLQSTREAQPEVQ